MALKKLSKAMAVTATAAMMVSPMMAMAAYSPIPEASVDDYANGDVDGVVATVDNGVVTDLMIDQDHDGQPDDVDTVVAIVGTDGKTYHFIVEDGRFSKNLNTTDGNGKINPYEIKNVEFASGTKDASFIVVDGVINESATGIIKSADLTKSYYANAGMIQSDYTGLAWSYKGVTPAANEDPNKWYVVNGVIDQTKNGIFEVTDTNGVKNTWLLHWGAVNQEYRGIINWNDGKAYLVYDGMVFPSWTGTCTINGNAYEVNAGVIASWIPAEDLNGNFEFNGNVGTLADGVLTIAE